jgi:shikimate kinase
MQVSRVLLVGFMAAGKSTVGRLVADELGWILADSDAEVVARDGRSIPEIFQAEGEAGFRALESEVVSGLLDLDGAVLVPGGGWPAWRGERGDDPPPLSRGLPGTLTVWLKVGPEAAAARAREQRSAEQVVRPLLTGADGGEGAARRLLAEREPLYGLADLHLDTEGRSPVEIAATIVHRVRSANASPGPGK